VYVQAAFSETAKVRRGRLCAAFLPPRPPKGKNLTSRLNETPQISLNILLLVSSPNTIHFRNMVSRHSMTGL
jgi:hypothetical protein